VKEITALIADDEEELRRHLIRLLNELWPELVIAGESENGPETLRLFDSLSPDIVFLDINMPGFSGLEVAKQISGQCTIVFITAYDQYALEAFERQALDYILKPVQKERLAASLERCKKKFTSTPPEPQDLGPLLLLLEKKLGREKTSPFLQWIRAQHRDSIRLIPVEDVLLFKAEDKYTLVITAKNESLIRKTIKELEDELDPDKFWKIHRGTIVNVSSILKISRSLTGRYVIRLDGYEEPLMVSRSFSHLFKQM
jgi:DNA-binding LytR/AlgR family response regulator